ncbi:hypothetical protein PN498_08930 [Oscillatoria sp. CS-180]|uniref:hypothetical protein n=1 Tax=Oscillatoria sp. CS-180 TaxID=3021720 RepID=UPI0023300A7B|nr:hypothetical protein [Oscillatoria sp. CS-180]MDB9526109.1 hypothetical protein [Oscillatoria sp. CS-180]
MHLEELKQKLEHLDDTQLQLVARFVHSLEGDMEQPWNNYYSEQTPQEKAETFLTWISNLPKVGHSLPDEAFDRAALYD